MQANGPVSRHRNQPLSLTRAAATTEKLTQAQEEIRTLRRLHQPQPGLTAGIQSWQAAVRKLAAADRKQILDTVIRARNLFRWARRRNRLKNLRWQRNDPQSELRKLARMARMDESRQTETPHQGKGRDPEDIHDILEDVPAATRDTPHETHESHEPEAPAHTAPAHTPDPTPILTGSLVA